MQATLQHLDDRYLTVLTEITSLLLEDAPPEVVCNQLFVKLQSVLQLDAFFHFRVTTDGLRLKLACCHGCPEDRLPEVEHLEFGQAVCGTVAQRRQSMYVPNIPQCHNDLAEFVRSIGITCYTCQPLIVNDKLLGTFSFGTRSRTEYAESELKLIQLVCDQVAIATHRAFIREQHVKLERLAVAGQLSARIAHEINNPLEAVINILYLLRGMQLGQQAGAFIALAEEQLNRVGQISRQTLSYYRETASPTAVDLRHAAESARAVLSGMATKKSVNVNVAIPHQMHVHAVDTELIEILTNLMANAIFYTPERETVEVEAQRVNGHIEVHVRDCGPGISAKIAARLFQPFATTKDDKGNGLGLWISRELARRVGGELSLSHSDIGATFTLRLRRVVESHVQ